MDVLLTPSRIRRLFLRTIDAMEKHPDDFVLHPGRDFTRHRRLPLKDLILLMMSMETSSIGGEIHRFFSLRYPKQPFSSLDLLHSHRLYRVSSSASLPGGSLFP